MTNPDRVLLDTSALYALISSTDEFHETAEEAYRKVLAGDADLWITSYVFVEFSALVHRRLGFDPIATFVESIRDVYETLWVDSAIHSRAWAQFNERRGGGLSFVDWTTLVAAQQIGAAILTLDSGFAREGAEVVPILG